MPIFLAGVIAQPGAACANTTAEATKPVNATQMIRISALHPVPRRQCAPTPLTLPERASRGDCSRGCHVVAGH
jgi:hypothetical protein